MSLMPTPTKPGFINGSVSDDGSSWSYTFAPGTRLDCYTYANTTVFGNNSASCQTLAYNYGVNETDLQFWNPILNGSCTLDPSQTYCVQLMQMNSTNATSSCVAWDIPDSHWSCANFLSSWGLDLDEFSSWNPSVGSKCENWRFG